MSGLRTGLAFRGADAASVVQAARLADEWNIETLWIGDPAGTAANSDDTYVMVAAAAAASATTHVRLGVFLSARSSSPPLRIAEDVGVVDQISAGRLAVAFSRPPSPGDDDEWLADLVRIARAPHDWDLGDGHRMPVTPAPAQPSVPMAVFEPGGAPLVARPLQTASSPVLVAIGWPDPASAPASDDLMRLKAGGAEVGAHEVVLLVADTASPTAADLASIFAVVGSVVAPCLRAADHEVPILALDATRWLEQRGALHQPPAGG